MYTTLNPTQEEAGKKGENDPLALAVADVSFPGMAQEDRFLKTETRNLIPDTRNPNVGGGGQEGGE